MGDGRWEMGDIGWKMEDEGWRLRMGDRRWEIGDWGRYDLPASQNPATSHQYPATNT
jgi:hypothetical protein